jgi:hypothetical protein
VTWNYEFILDYAADEKPRIHLSSACSIPPKTPTDNVMQLVDLLEKHGYY